MGKKAKGRKPTGFGLGRPIEGGGALSDIGDLRGGGVLRQVGSSCGTCSVAAVLGHYGMESNQRDVDREIRAADIFTATGLMAGYARGRGFEAVFRNRGSVDELKGLIDRDIPVILIVDTRPGDPFHPRALHFVTAVSYHDADGFRLGVYNPWGVREEITGEELSNSWNEVRIGPLVCWESAYLAIAPKGSGLGKGRQAGCRGMNMLSLAVANAVNGAVHILRYRHILKGLLELAAAGPEFVVGLSMFIFEQVKAFS